MTALDLDEAAVDAALSELEQEGFIERVNPGEEPARWKLTEQGADEAADMLFAAGFGGLEEGAP